MQNRFDTGTRGRVSLSSMDFPAQGPHMPPLPTLSPDARFRWTPRVRCYQKGIETCADDLYILRTALTDQREFRVEASGITLLGEAPYLQCGTGGSSGAPKVIRRSQASWIASFHVNQARFGITDADRYAVLGELVHSLALYGVIEALHLGADLHLMAGMRPGAQADLIASAEISVLYATPAQLRLLTRAGRAPMPKMRQVLCGGGAVDTHLRAQIAALFPNAECAEFYGASETSFIAMSDRSTPQGSVGQPYPNTQIRIEAPMGETGLIWIKSPYLFAEYAQGMSAETRWNDGFLTVGELGHFDAQGNLFVQGRAGRMVRIADQTVYPEAVEILMCEVANGRHCAVIARPDPARGAVLIGVLSGAQDDALAARVLENCRATLGPLTMPKRIIFLKEFPLLPSGKPNLMAIQAHTEALT